MQTCILGVPGAKPRPRKNSFFQQKEVFFTSFSLVGGWVGKPENPTKKHFFCVRHAEGMRACTHGATHRSDSVARSTPTA